MYKCRYAGFELNYLLVTSIFLKYISLSTVLIIVKNMKNPLSVIKIKMLQNFYTPIRITNYNILSLSFWSKCKSALHLQNEKAKVVNSHVKNNIY